KIELHLDRNFFFGEPPKPVEMLRSEHDVWWRHGGIRVLGTCCFGENESTETSLVWSQDGENAFIAEKLVERIITSIFSLPVLGHHFQRQIAEEQATLFGIARQAVWNPIGFRTWRPDRLFGDRGERLFVKPAALRFGWLAKITQPPEE